MATITIDDAELRELVRKHAQRAAAEYLTNRTIPDFPTYFMNNHWLVTYEWMADADRRLSERIMQLELQVARLERPWWKRWFSR